MVMLGENNDSDADSSTWYSKGTAERTKNRLMVVNELKLNTQSMRLNQLLGNGILLYESI
jgi:hypothetical protein